MTQIYHDGTYLEHNPDWHEEDSPWKADLILQMLRRNGVTPDSIAEIGCGAGGILVEMAKTLESTRFHGYEISSQAFEKCQTKATDRVSFRLEDLLESEDSAFDVVMAIDVFEHVEDHFKFLRALRSRGQYKIFHIPLDLSASALIRSTPLIEVRRAVGHLHYFTRATAIATLEETGYEIVDEFFTAGSLVTVGSGLKTSLLRLPRRLAFALSPEYASRVLGGFSLMVLAR